MSDALVLRPMLYAAAGSGGAPLTPNEIACLSDVRDVLRARGLLNRFGMCRPSDQSHLLDWEVMYEIADVGARVLHARPEADRWAQPAIETQWVFSEKQVGRRCQIYCGINSRGHYPGHAERTASDNPVKATQISS